MLQYHRRDFAALTDMFYELLSVVVECESAFVDVGVGRVFTQPPLKGRATGFLAQPLCLPI
jgi:hypothetical protein